MDKKDMNIESYDEQDAFYTGSDEEYEEFLKNADIKLNDGEKAESVANTQRINLNETINIQSVIDKFKKTAGGIENGAKKFKNTVVNTMDMFKTKNDDSDVSGKNAQSGNDKDADTPEATDKMNDFIEEADAILEMKSDVSSAKTELNSMSSDITELSKKIDDLADKIKSAELKSREGSIKQQSFYDDLRRTVNDMTEGISEVKQSISSVIKVNDSIFDLKNTQYNTKNALLNLETAFNRLKKKCVLGVTVLSILSAIVIVLEIVLMLS